MRRKLFLPLLAALAIFALLPSRAAADSLTIQFNVAATQTVVVGTTGFAEAIYTGTVTNNTNAPITFQLTGGPTAPSPYLASFMNGIPYPGMTIGANRTTSIIDLVTLAFNPFDPSLSYPGTMNFFLDAIRVDPTTGHTGGTITEIDGRVRVLRNVPEPSAMVLMLTLVGCLGILAARRAQSA